jgi:hypothetical protein
VKAETTGFEAVMFDSGAVIVLWLTVDIGNAAGDNGELYAVACQVRFYSL